MNISKYFQFCDVYYIEMLCSWKLSSLPSILLFCVTCTVSYEDVTNHPNWNLFDHDVCGNGAADRIIGGKEAALGQFPWLARIGYNLKTRRDRPPRFLCGASLINQMYVLTAAHCVAQLPGNRIVSAVRLGENYANSEVDCDGYVCAPPVRDYLPVKLIVHKDYGNPAYKNDIALIRLDRPAMYNAYTVPICLPRGNQLTKNYLGATTHVAGWGVFDMDIEKPSNSLLYVSLPVVELDRCIVAFKKSASIDDNQICVGGIVGKDSCAGDSGGPLMKPEAINGPPRMYMIGIVSFGSRQCGGSTTPAVYTRLSSYVNWVLENISP